MSLSLIVSLALVAAFTAWALHKISSMAEPAEERSSPRP